MTTPVWNDHQTVRSLVDATERTVRRYTVVVTCLGLLTFVVAAAIVAIALHQQQDNPCHQALGFAHRAFLADSDPTSSIYTVNKDLFNKALTDCLK